MAQGKRSIVYEAPEAAEARRAQVKAVQELYKDPMDFVYRVLVDLKKLCVAEILADICAFMMDPTKRAIMVQAQRGQAKSTLAAIGIAWDLIMHPNHRNAVVMSNSKKALDVIIMVRRIFHDLPELEPWLPDPKGGDRTGIQAWDVHHSLRNLSEKSPSLCPISIEESLQGKRTDFTVLDDLEDSKTGFTAEGRANILRKALDLYAICEYRIIWLGTPQSMDSIYFELPKQGVEVRVWPGRFPTEAEETFYGETLAPWVKEKMRLDPSLRIGGGIDGSRGRVTCPEFRKEDFHQSQELTMGKEWYELQYMLNATLTDAGRKPLNPRDLLVVPHGEDFPITLAPGLGPGYTHKHVSGGRTWELAIPTSLEGPRAKPVIKAFIDPAAGGNTSKDRTAFTVIGLVKGNLVVLSYGSVPGGYEKETLHKLAKYLAPHRPAQVCIEKNMGFGAFKQVFQPILLEEAAKVGWNPGVDEVMVHGQKEVRIIETLGPVMGRRSLWITTRALQEEAMYVEGLQAGDLASYSLFVQMASITRVKGCLRHDDLVDALAGCVDLFREELAIDANIQSEKLRMRNILEMERALLKEDQEKYSYKPLGRGRRKHGNRS